MCPDFHSVRLIHPVLVTPRVNEWNVRITWRPQASVGQSGNRHREVLTGLNMANAVLHGHGGIWVMHTPYLLFYPDADGDDVPDRDPEARLAGFGLEDTHSVAKHLTV